jgi:Flp pilus assembly pilin Flp
MTPVRVQKVVGVAASTYNLIRYCQHDKESIMLFVKVAMKKLLNQPLREAEELSAPVVSCGYYLAPYRLLPLGGIQRILCNGPRMKSAVVRFCGDEQGQDLIEYTLLLAFIVLGSAALMTKAGTSVKTVWAAGSTTLANAATSAS